MTIQISFSGDASERDLRSLGDWLRNEPEIRQHAKITIGQPAPRPGQMGTAFEVVQLVVQSGFQLGSLAVAIASWRRSGASSSPIIVNGTVILGGTATDPAQIAQELEAGGVENGTAGS